MLDITQLLEILVYNLSVSSARRILFQFVILFKYLNTEKMCIVEIIYFSIKFLRVRDTSPISQSLVYFGKRMDNVTYRNAFKSTKLMTDHKREEIWELCGSKVTSFVSYHNLWTDVKHLPALKMSHRHDQNRTSPLCHLSSFRA